jgi:hypothetical protein
MHYSGENKETSNIPQSQEMENRITNLLRPNQQITSDLRTELIKRLTKGRP